MAIEIFFCYAHEDEQLLKSLKAHLRPLQQENLVTLWYDRNINAGTEWKNEIDLRLNSADIIILLISPDFMNSDYCYSVEMKQAIERHRQGSAQVVPVILRYVHWQLTVLKELQALPSDGKPIRSWVDIDEGFYNVVEGLRPVVERMQQKKSISKSHNQFFANGEDDVAIFEQLKHQLIKWLRVEAIQLNIDSDGKSPSALIEQVRSTGNFDETHLQVISTLLNLANGVIKSEKFSVLDYKQALMFLLMHTRTDKY